MPQQERRRSQRFLLQQPVSLAFSNEGCEQIAALTENVCSRGIYLFSDTFIEEGSRVGLIVYLPPEFTLREGIRIWCLGKVVRLDQTSPGGNFGIAVEVERYQVLLEA